MRRVLVLAFAVGTIGVVAVAVVAAVAVWAPDDEQSEIRFDAAALRETELRLAELEREIKVLPAPDEAATSSATEIHGCYLDSGDIGQPWVGRTWQVEAGQGEASALEVVESMRQAGWTSIDRSGRGSYELVSSRKGWSAHAWVGAMFEEDGVYLDARVQDAAPCFLASK